MRQLFVLIFINFLLTNCSYEKSSQVKSGIFISRVHTTDLKTDWYKPLGPTNLIKHLKDFKSIDWEREYWKEDSAKTYEASDLEVLDEENSKYFSISVCPNTFESFQFYVGLGKQIENPENGNIKRTIRLYGTATDEPEKALSLLRLFFAQDFDKLEEQLAALDFFEEIEDVYHNIEKE